MQQRSHSLPKRYNKIRRFDYRPVPLVLQGISNKTEQIGNRSQLCKAAQVIWFLIQIDHFGTYE